MQLVIAIALVLATAVCACMGADMSYLVSNLPGVAFLTVVFLTSLVAWNR